MVEFAPKGSKKLLLIIANFHSCTKAIKQGSFSIRIMPLPDTGVLHYLSEQRRNIHKSYDQLVYFSDKIRLLLSLLEKVIFFRLHNDV